VDGGFNSANANPSVMTVDEILYYYKSDFYKQIGEHLGPLNGALSDSSSHISSSFEEIKNVIEKGVQINIDYVASTVSKNESINGLADSSKLGQLNIRQDKVVLDTFLSLSEFTTSSDNSHVNIFLNGGTSNIKTLNDIEVIQFKDAAVRIVGADGYSSFAEAMNKNNNSHALNGEYIYGSSSHGHTPTPSDLEHLTAVAGISDFYTYHG
jgi:hypothetical protein